jgi:8-oxo-dGTP diphosphatase
MRQVFTDATAHEGGSPFRFCPQCGRQLSPVRGRLRCGACGYAAYRNPAPGVAVLVVQNGAVLLGRRAKPAGTWSLPGGFIEYGESFLQATHREVREETGLEIHVDGIINVVSNFLRASRQTLVIVLTASPVGGVLRPGDDLVELRWNTGDELPPMAFDADAYIVREFLAGPLRRLPVDPSFAGPDSGGHREQ